MKIRNKWKFAPNSWLYPSSVTPILTWCYTLRASTNEKAHEILSTTTYDN